MITDLLTAFNTPMAMIGMAVLIIGFIALLSIPQTNKKQKKNKKPTIGILLFFYFIFIIGFILYISGIFIIGRWVITGVGPATIFQWTLIAIVTILVLINLNSSFQQLNKKKK